MQAQEQTQAVIEVNTDMTVKREVNLNLLGDAYSMITRVILDNPDTEAQINYLSGPSLYGTCFDVLDASGVWTLCLQSAFAFFTRQIFHVSLEHLRISFSQKQ
jgi:hypothetical protein